MSREISSMIGARYGPTRRRIRRPVCWHGESGPPGRRRNRRFERDL